jgi:ligand-binding sensor domain-containing protein
MFILTQSAGRPVLSTPPKWLWTDFSSCLSLLKVCAILPLVIAHSVWGAAPVKIASSHKYDIWDRGAGFPGGFVYSIAQTRDGHLWIGTSQGLVRYDGLTFVSIPQSDSSAGTKFPVVGLVTDSTDQLWATDDHGHLFRYTAGRLEGPLPDTGTHLHRVGPVNKSHDGWLLSAGEMQGLVEYRRGSARLLLDSSAIPRSPTTVAQTADGTFWIGTRDKGIFRIEVTEGAPEVQHIAGLPDAKINCLLPIAASTL